MSPTEFRSLLHDVAEQQEPVTVDPATFTRGRRARRRSLAVGAGAVVLAVLAGVTAVTALQPDRALLAGSDTAPALPDRVYAVPERLTTFTERSGETWDERIVSPTLAVGQSSVAYAPGTISPGVVVVSATTGAYSALALPGFDHRGTFLSESHVAALSPDGRRLVYAWHETAPATEDYAPSGARMLDLVTGEVTDLPEREGFGVHTSGFRWSPNGRFVSYSVAVRNVSPSESRGSKSFFQRVLDTQDGTSVTMTDARAGEQWGSAPSPEGRRVVTTNPAELRTVADGRVTDLPGQNSYGGGAWSADGALVAYGVAYGVQVVTTAGEVVGQFGLDRGPEGFRDHVVGWIGRERIAVVLATGDTARLLSVSATVPLEAQVAPAELVALDAAVPLGQVSFATDLLDQPTRGFPAPDWPADREWLWWAGIGLLVTAAGLGSAYLSRRRVS